VVCSGGETQWVFHKTPTTSGRREKKKIKTYKGKEKKRVKKQPRKGTRPALGKNCDSIGGKKTKPPIKIAHKKKRNGQEGLGQTKKKRIKNESR